MKIHIDEEILKRYSAIEIGYLVADVKIRKTDPFVEDLKKHLGTHLKEKGINATNFVAHQNISIWRKIYEEDFHVNARTYRSSIESLLRRIVTGKEIWNICNVVDLYNCCSILSLLPMGGYDFSKISGNIKMRFSQNGEPFRGIGEKAIIQTKADQVIYSDEARVMCWLWNHKDSIETCIDETTTKVLFFIDSADSYETKSVPQALEQLDENLKRISSKTLFKGVLNRDIPMVTLEV